MIAADRFHVIMASATSSAQDDALKTMTSELRAKLIEMEDSIWRHIRDERLGRLTAEKNVTPLQLNPMPERSRHSTGKYQCIAY